ncbi:hypothetical protein SAMN04487949_0579 [Halogranum gelatinilyticum]|uniref:Uncharacterized protein n=1 Tax=Halogranum gelatinilyticum TaxID=660521 RepID=A0A1G9PWZ9_9EURY|nr:hypothetical protein [Halogranum gelatinilyticum]SDM03274.1 hypothetical protein SAMN04487949_0579 [Halogranum gelatinilyticum]
MTGEWSRRRFTEAAEYMATQLCAGFRAHDNREYERAVDAFFEVDRRQFAHLDDETARRGAVAYVDALWAKDAIEAEYTDEDGSLRTAALDTADWCPVESAFAERAEAFDIDRRYASKSTEAWRRHKVGGDYWTPMMAAQTYELRAALCQPSYPDKPSDGESGFGPEATRYALGVELHDMHTATHWEQATATMTPYFEYVLSAHEEQTRLDGVPVPP